MQFMQRRNDEALLARTKDHMSVRMTNDTKNDSSTSKMSGLFQRTLTRKAMKYAIG